LTRIEPDGEVRPDLASEWRLSPDGKQYTFRLRPEARWHDGRPVAADDVVATVNQLQAPEFPGDPALASLWRGVTAEAASGEVRFTLPRADAWFPEKASIGVVPANAGGRPVGAGPFRVVAADARHVQLERFDGYHGRKPYLGLVEMRFYASVDAAVAGLRSGEANALRPLPADALTAPPPDGFARFEIEERGHRQLLVFNTRAAPFDDPAARAKVVRALAGGAPDPPEPRFTIVTNDRPERVRLAEELARRLGRVGARVEVQAVGWTGMVADVLQPGRFQAALIEHADGLVDGDPSPFWSAGGALNFGRWRSEHGDALLARAREAMSPAARRDALREWRAVFEAEVPAVVLGSPRLAYWVSQEIRDASAPSVVGAPRERFARIAEWHVFTRRAPGRF
jgi:ABC-type transport system substrate-binding protein